MKAILRILLLFMLCAFASEATAQTTAVTPSGDQVKKGAENTKASPGTYLILFREDHKEVIAIDDQLLHRIEKARRASETVYLRVNENILVKVLPPGTPAPANGDDDFIYVPNTQFNELLQQAI